MSNTGLVIWEGFVLIHTRLVYQKRKQKKSLSSRESFNQGYSGNLPECHTAPWIPSGLTSSVFDLAMSLSQEERVRAPVHITRVNFWAWWQSLWALAGPSRGKDQVKVRWCYVIRPNVVFAQQRAQHAASLCRFRGKQLHQNLITSWNTA